MNKRRFLFFTQKLCFVKYIFFLAPAFFIFGCATSYGPAGLTGGYSAKKIDDVTYTVIFSGNGHTSRETVWDYWIYRCAELTIQNGYQFFMILPTPNATQVPESSEKNSPLADMDFDIPQNQLATHSTQTFYYVPGNAITKFIGHGTIKMSHNSKEYNGNAIFRASTIIEMLAPFIKSPSQAHPPSDQEILKAAYAGPNQTKNPINRNLENKPVTLDDLKNLMPNK